MTSTCSKSTVLCVVFSLMLSMLIEKYNFCTSSTCIHMYKSLIYLFITGIYFFEIQSQWTALVVAAVALEVEVICKMVEDLVLL